MARGKVTKRIDNLHEALRWLREESRLTQEDLATSAGMKAPYYGEIERGKRYPGDEKLGRIVRALGTDVERVETLAATRPWEVMRSASTARMRSMGLDMKSAVSKLGPQEIGGNYALRAISRLGDGAPLGLPDGSMQALSFMPPAEPSSSLPTDTESAELLAIYTRLPRSEQLSLMGVARSLGKRIE